MTPIKVKRRDGRLREEIEEKRNRIEYGVIVVQKRHANYGGHRRKVLEKLAGVCLNLMLFISLFIFRL
jgi:hypothetical protein